MNKDRFVQIIKFHNSTVMQDLADYHSTGVQTRDKQMDPKTSEVSQEFVIPSPKKGEKQPDFIARCIGKVGKEYTKPGQSYAVCIGKWTDKGK